jgi:hypothetical protein
MFQNLMRTLDAMSLLKFNVLHWHITDAESFPFASTQYPLLQERSTFAPEAVYTAKDVHLAPTRAPSFFCSFSVVVFPLKKKIVFVVFAYVSALLFFVFVE